MYSIIWFIFIRPSSGQQISLENLLEFGVFALYAGKSGCHFEKNPCFSQMNDQNRIGPFDPESFHGAMVIFGSLAQRLQKIGLKNESQDRALIYGISFILVGSIVYQE